MTDLVLRLLGARVDDAVRIADASLALRGGLGAGWVVLGLLATIVAVAWLYRASPVMLSPLRRHILTALRVLFLGLLLVLLLRPVLAFTVEGSVRRILVLLIDASASMRIRDPRQTPEDRQRAALARGLADPAGGLKSKSGSGRPAAGAGGERLELVQAALRNEALNLLPRLDREFDLAAFTFAQGVAEISARKAAPASTNGRASRREPVTVDQFPWVDRLTATNPLTALGDALREVMARKRGQPLAGVLVVTDGANNSGMPPGEAALLARREGLPLYIYGVGITSPRDVILVNLFAPDVTFARDEMTAAARVRTRGMNGRNADLVLKLNGQTVASQTVTFGADGEQVVPLRFIPAAVGEFDLEAVVVPQADENVQDNNRRSRRLRVIDAKIHTLLVDQSPRWEFRYLQAMLLRDRRIDLKCYLAESDKDIARLPGSPYLAAFPARKEDLFKFDLVIYGDVDPRRVGLNALENLNTWVADFGGALVAVAGRRFLPHAYKRSLLEKLLPVEFDAPIVGASPDALADKPITLQLTFAGRHHAMLRLSDKDEENVALWKELPPVFWVARVARPKPAAEVLLVDPDPARETRFGKMPVIAFQKYGLGQVLYVGTDNTWRWRRNVGDRYYSTLWGQIAQRVSLQRLLGISKRTQLTTDQHNYMTGDRIGVYARLYTAGYDPLSQPAVKGHFGLRNGTGPRPEVILRPVPEQPGLYRGEFIAPAAGTYSFWVDSDTDTFLDFNVSEPKFELGETAMNEPLLRELAATTGGAFFREEDLHRLPDTIRDKTERVRSPLEVELWSSPLFFLLLLGVVTAEWVLRKLAHLK
ncbi:MAG: hypothetical protein JXQ71_02780 [Verrucomicrobia bacterium]|nr:hypothetical protein [Verrucomicrobiota bacterium]